MIWKSWEIFLLFVEQFSLIILISIVFWSSSMFNILICINTHWTGQLICFHHNTNWAQPQTQQAKFYPDLIQDLLRIKLTVPDPEHEHKSVLHGIDDSIFTLTLINDQCGSSSKDHFPTGIIHTTRSSVTQTELSHKPTKSSLTLHVKVRTTVITAVINTVTVITAVTNTATVITAVINTVTVITAVITEYYICFFIVLSFMLHLND